jgi:hypothetical protein
LASVWEPFVRAWLVLSVPAALVMVAPLWWSPETILSVSPPCPWKALFGTSCPSCGMTRAFLLIAQGQPGEARLANPWSVWVYVLLVLNSFACLVVAGLVGRRMLGGQAILNGYLRPRS